MHEMRVRVRIRSPAMCLVRHKRTRMHVNAACVRSQFTNTGARNAFFGLHTRAPMCSTCYSTASAPWPWSPRTVRGSPDSGHTSTPHSVRSAGGDADYRTEGEQPITAWSQPPVTVHVTIDSYAGGAPHGDRSTRASGEQEHSTRSTSTRRRSDPSCEPRTKRPEDREQ